MSQFSRLASIFMSLTGRAIDLYRKPSIPTIVLARFPIEFPIRAPLFGDQYRSARHRTAACGRSQPRCARSHIALDRWQPRGARKTWPGYASSIPLDRPHVDGPESRGGRTLSTLGSKQARSASTPLAKALHTTFLEWFGGRSGQMAPGQVGRRSP